MHNPYKLPICLFCLLSLYCGFAKADIIVFSSDGLNAKKATFEDAVSASDASGKTIIVTSHYTLARNLIWPSDRLLKIEKGGQLTIPAGIAFTAHSVDAGDYQIFAGDGKVFIRNGNVNSFWFQGGNDSEKVSSAIASLKGEGSRGGTITVPASMDARFVLPKLNLSPRQAISIRDLRVDVDHPPMAPFGSILNYVEGRDASGGYASEYVLQGIQNPAFVVNSLSDGTALNYSIANKSSSFLHRSHGSATWQWITDPLFKGYDNYFLMQYSGGNGAIALDVGIDNNKKSRFDLTPALFASSKAIITNASNTSPIIITTATSHGIAGQMAPVAITGVTGNTAANGNWLVTPLTATTFRLNKSNGNGAYVSGGAVSAQVNRQRGILNVPAEQGGKISIVTEGQIASTIGTGSAPLSAQSKTVDANLHARPYMVSHAGIQQVGPNLGTGGAKIVTGTATLESGKAVVTLSGEATFSKEGKYSVFTSNQSSTNGIKTVVINNNTFVLTGTGMDVINWIALGY